MQLIEALRLGDTPVRLALVGAGGKTRSMFRIGRELLASRPDPGRMPVERVVVCATTHLGGWQAQLADQHYIVHQASDLTANLEAGTLPPGLTLFSGGPAQDNRLSGLDSPTLDALRDYADGIGAPLLIEADGARGRLLKAPAEHEPVIPPWVELVIVCAGLPALGQPCGPEIVHRPERFAALSGLSLGDPLNITALQLVLCSQRGGLQGVPSAARRVALLNGAHSPELQSAGGRLAEMLLGSFAAVLVADIPNETGPLPNEGPVHSVYEPVAGVILVAGASERYGSPKALLEWRGEPLVRHVARSALAACLAPVVVVTGAGAPGIQAALSGLELSWAQNPDWQQGQGSSVAAGARALPDQVGAVLFLLADQPQIPVSLLRALVEEHRLTLAPLVAPQAGGRRANPVLFDRVTLPELRQLSGAQGGRALFSRYPVHWLPWADESILLDVDTPQDYARLLALE